MTTAPQQSNTAARLKGYIPTLDGWRAFAILAVITYHLTNRALMPRYLLLVDDQLGQKGVELFFGISGLLITSRLLEERRVRGAISLRDFYIRRALRIIPPAYAYLVTIAVLGMVGVIATTKWGILSSLLFFRNYADGKDWFNAHYWSLAVEEHFYLLWPAILVFLGMLRARWAAATLILAVTAWRGFLWLQHGHGGDLPWFFYHTDTRLDALLCGALAAILIELYPSKIERRFKPAIAVPALSALFILMMLGLPYQVKTIGRLIQAAAVPLILTSTLLHPRAWISLFLENKVLRWIGRLSYSLYLWQQLFLGSGLHFWYLKLAAVFGAAGASYYLVERPAMRLGHRLAPPASAGHTDLRPAGQPVTAAKADAAAMPELAMRTDASV